MECPFCNHDKTHKHGKTTVKPSGKANIIIDFELGEDVISDVGLVRPKMEVLFSSSREKRAYIGKVEGDRDLLVVLKRKGCSELSCQLESNGLPFG